MNSVPPTILVIIGITGDLSTRKLLPAINRMLAGGTVPTEQLRIVGVTRRDVGVADVLSQVQAPTDHLAAVLQMYKMDLEDHAAYNQLHEHLTVLTQELGGTAQRLFYLSVPPQISQPIVRCLGDSGLSGNKAKLLLEKPFGLDFASAQDLIDQTSRSFSEDDIYRIDHFVAKHMAQTVLEARGQAGNAWGNETIKGITITATEQIGIEGGVHFYEQTGALRDVVQSHLLQLAALTVMDLSNTDVPTARLAALCDLRIPAGPISDSVVRGQYEGYRTEVANPHSTVETYVRLGLVSHDQHWQGVPITLVAGKALARKQTEIRIARANAEDLVFADDAVTDQAYEHVLVHAMQAKRSLFISSQEVLESWRILEPVRQAWDMSADDLVYYGRGHDPQFHTL